MPDAPNPPRIEPLTSPANPRIKALVRLRDDSAERRAAQRFTLETPRELTRALDAGFRLLEYYATPDAQPDLDADPLIRRAAADPAVRRFQLTADLLAKTTYRRSRSGFLAVLGSRRAKPSDLQPDPKGLYLVAAGLEKPGNLGAIIRSADAAAASAVLIDHPDPDLYHPNLVRASTGCVFSLPIAATEPNTLIEWLRAARLRIVALTADAETPYTDLDLTAGIALVLGTEARGLPDDWLHASDRAAAIPMRGAADSLNVSVAAAVLLFEARRQRS